MAATSSSRRVLLGATLLAVAAGESCSCERIVAVEDDLSKTRQEIADLRSTLADLVRERPKVYSADAHDAPCKVAAALGHASVPEPAARRLQLDAGGKTYTATRSWQLHEFPSGHTCNGPGKAYLKPKMAAEGMTECDYPTRGTSTQFSLMSNVDGQTRSEIQQMEAPLKVVHDSSCSSAPTLNLPLSTTVQTLTVSGTLTVGSTDVGAALSSSTTSSWIDCPLFSGMVGYKWYGAQDATNRPQYT